MSTGGRISEHFARACADTTALKELHSIADTLVRRLTQVAEAIHAHAEQTGEKDVSTRADMLCNSCKSWLGQNNSCLGKQSSWLGKSNCLPCVQGHSGTH